MGENRTFTAVCEDGNDIECEVVMYYNCLKNNKEYVFYTTGEVDEDDNLVLYASRYNGEDENGMILEEITDDNEWNLLDEALVEAKKGLEY